MSDSEIIQLPPSVPKEVSAASTLLPYRRDDLRSKYLGYLCCGFSDEEALYVLSLTISWLDRMRQDEQFCSLELRVPEFRKTLSQEYNELDFCRNFRMVMEKDHRVLRRSLGMDVDEDGEPLELSQSDQLYLLKLRGAYTPQQLQLLSSVASGTNDSFNFVEWVAKNQDTIQFSRTDTVTLSRGIDGKTPDNG